MRKNVTVSPPDCKECFWPITEGISQAAMKTQSVISSLQSNRKDVGMKLLFSILFLGSIITLLNSFILLLNLWKRSFSSA